MRWSEIAVLVLVVLVVVGWLLWVSASRLDRLHRKVMSSRIALDAQLVRRATSALELAASGELDPASSMLLAEAAHTVLSQDAGQDLADAVPGLVDAVPSLVGAAVVAGGVGREVMPDAAAAVPASPPPRRLLGGMSDERAYAESVLSATLRAALDGPDEIADLVSTPVGAELLHSLASAWYRAQLARRFHNEAVAQTMRFRAKPYVRVFHLAGHAPMPTPVDYDDVWPPALISSAAA